MDKLKIETRQITPRCPHCEKEVQELIQVDRGWFHVHNVFCCPHCLKIVGMTAVGA